MPELLTFEDLTVAWREIQPEYFRADTSGFVECDWLGHIALAIEHKGWGWALCKPRGNSSPAYHSEVVTSTRKFKGSGYTKAEALLRAYTTALNFIGVEVSGMVF